VDWDEVAKRRNAAQNRENVMVIANFVLGSCWAVTFVYSLMLYTHEGLSSMLAPDHDISWTLFSYGMIGNLILLSLVVSLGYFALRYHIKRVNERNEHTR